LLTTRFVNPVNQLAFMVALPKVELQAVRLRSALTQRLHIGQRLRAIHSRLTRTEQIQIGAIQNQEFFHKQIAFGEESIVPLPT
jgi:hypothetical protein